jgi:hypothetical protein
MTTRLFTKRLTPVSVNGSSRSDLGRPQVSGLRTPRNGRTNRDAIRRASLSRSFYSDATGQALLFAGAGSNADRVGIAYHGLSVECHLWARGRALLAGEFQSELIVDGTAVETLGDWKSTCWSSDDDGDYLEMQLVCSDEVRIDRQFLLSRRGHFALFADAVVTSAPARIEYRLSLPVAGGASMRTHRETRECAVGAARVFPVGLPQDRVLSSPGNCFENSGRLHLTQVAKGHGLYLPVVFDWHPRRRRASADWRSLTVTEHRRVVSPDSAAGHRLRVGKEQLLIYRSLADTREARAVLGQHTRYETVIGSIDAGELAPIVMVEMDPLTNA